MICLKYEAEYQLAVCNAVLRRAKLTDEERQRVEEEMWRISSGRLKQYPEEYVWESFRYIKGGCRMFHNLKVEDAFGYTYKIDTLFICSAFILVVEPNDRFTELTISITDNQYVGYDLDERVMLPNLFDRLSLNKLWLENFLKDLGLENIPVFQVVLLTLPYTECGWNEPFYVLNSKSMSYMFDVWYEQYPALLNEEKLDFLTEAILARNIRNWKLTAVEQLQLRCGFICECGQQMIYRFGTCKCECGAQSIDAVLRGLHDYRLLVDEWITKKEFKEFFKVDNMGQVGRLFKRLELKSESSKRNERYYIPKDIFQHPLSRGRIQEYCLPARERYMMI